MSAFSCADCGSIFLIWGYDSFITNEAAGIAYGQRTHAKVCPRCDKVDLWPRHREEAGA